MRPPTTLIIGLTNKCTTHCTFCYSRDETVNPPYLSLDRYKALLRELKWVNNIEFSGIGEPTLHPQFQEFVAYTRETYPNMNIQLVTNGSLLYPDMVKFLTNQKVNQIWISTNAATDRVREQVMPKTNVSIIWNAVTMLKGWEFKPRVLTSFVVTKDNYQESELFIDKSLKSGVDGALIRPVDRMLGQHIYNEQSVSKEQFEKIYNRIRIRSMYQKRVSISPKSSFWGDNVPKLVKCDMRNTVFGLYYSSGEVTFCCYMAANIKEYSIGNIYQSSANEIWESPTSQHLRFYCELCKNCNKYW